MSKADNKRMADREARAKRSAAEREAKARSFTPQMSADLDAAAASTTKTAQAKTKKVAGRKTFTPDDLSGYPTPLVVKKGELQPAARPLLAETVKPRDIQPPPITGTTVDTSQRAALTSTAGLTMGSKIDPASTNLPGPPAQGQESYSVPTYGYENQPSLAEPPTRQFETTNRAQVKAGKVEVKGAPVKVVDIAKHYRGGYDSGSTETEDTFSRLKQQADQGVITPKQFELGRANLQLRGRAVRYSGTAMSPKAQKRMTGIWTKKDPTAAAVGAGVDRGGPATEAFPDKNLYIHDEEEKQKYYTGIQQELIAHVGQRQETTKFTNVLDKMVRKNVPGVSKTARPEIQSDKASAIAPWFRQAGLALARNIGERGASYEAYSTLDLVDIAETFGERYGIQRGTARQDITGQAEKLATKYDLPALIRLANDHEVAGFETLRGAGGKLDDKVVEQFAERARTYQPSEGRKNGQPILGMPVGEEGARQRIAQQIITSTMVKGTMPQLFKGDEREEAKTIQNTTGRFVQRIEETRVLPEDGVLDSDKSHAREDDHFGDSAERDGDPGYEDTQGSSISTRQHGKYDTDREVRESLAYVEASLQQVGQGQTPTWRQGLRMTPRQGASREIVAERSDRFKTDFVQEMGRIPAENSTNTFRQEGLLGNALPLNVIGSQERDSVISRAMADIFDAPDWRSIQQAHNKQVAEITELNQGLSRAEQFRVPRLMTGRDARRKQRQIQSYNRDIQGRIEAAQNDGNVSEKEYEREYMGDQNDTVSTANQAIGIDHTLTEAYKNMGGFAPDPLTVALRQSSLTSDIPRSRKESELYKGRDGSQDKVGLADIGQMLVDAREVTTFKPVVNTAKNRVLTKDISNRNLDRPYEFGNTPAQILRNSDVNEDVFEMPYNTSQYNAEFDMSHLLNAGPPSAEHVHSVYRGKTQEDSLRMFSEQEQLPLPAASADDIVFSRLKEQTKSLHKMESPTTEHMQQAYGVASPALARTFFAAGSGALRYDNEVEQLREQSRANPDNAEMKQQLIGMEQFSTLRGSFGAAAAESFEQKLDVREQRPINPQYVTPTREAKYGKEPKTWRDADMGDLVPQSERWRRDAEQMARREVKASDWDIMKMIPKSERKRQAEIYRAMRDTQGADTGREMFADYQRGMQVLSAVSRSSDLGSYKGMLDPMGKDLNISIDMTSPTAINDFIRGQANRSATIPGLGNPVSAAADRSKNTRAFLGRLGMTVNNGNVTDKEIDGDMAGALSDNKGMADAHLTNVQSSISDLAARYQDMADALDRKVDVKVPVVITTADGKDKTIMQSTSHVRKGLEKQEAELVKGFQRHAESTPFDDNDAMFTGFLQRIGKNNFELNEKDSALVSRMQPILGDSSNGLALNRLQRLQDVRQQIHNLPSAESYRSVMTRRADELDRKATEQAGIFSAMKPQLGDVPNIETPEGRSAVEALSKHEDTPEEHKEAYKALLSSYDTRQDSTSLRGYVEDTYSTADDYRARAAQARRVSSAFNDDKQMDQLAQFMQAGMGGIAERVRGIPLENGGDTGYGRTQIREQFKEQLESGTADEALERLTGLLDLHDEFRGMENPRLNEENTTRLAGILGAKTDHIAGAFGASSASRYDTKRGDFLFGVNVNPDAAMDNTAINDAVRQAVGPGMNAKEEKARRQTADEFIKTFESRATDEQQAILDSDPTGLRVINAGPGGGKTGVVAARAAQIAKQRDVTVNTFSRSAAQEVRDRLAPVQGDEAKRMRVNTTDAEALMIFSGGAMKNIKNEAIPFGISSPDRAIVTAQDRQGVVPSIRFGENIKPMGSDSDDEDAQKKTYQQMLGNAIQRLGTSGRQDAMKMYSSKTKDGVTTVDEAKFTENMGKQIQDLVNQGMVGDEYLKTVSWVDDSGKRRANLPENATDAQKSAAQARMFLGQAMQSFHQEQADRGEYDYDFMKETATRLLTKNERVRQAYKADTAMGIVDEANDTKNLEARFSAARFGGGLTVMGDLGQNVGVGFRDTAVNFGKAFKSAWNKWSGRKTQDDKSLTISQRQGPAAMAAANAVLGEENKGNPSFGAERAGTFSYKNYTYDKNLTTEVKGQVQLFKEMVDTGTIDLQKHNIGFFTRTNDVRKNIGSELKSVFGDDVKILQPDDKWVPGGVYVGTNHKVKGKTYDVGFGIGFGVGRQNLSERETDFMDPREVKRILGQGDDPRNKGLLGTLQSMFLGNVAASRSNITILSGSGKISPILQPAITALKKIQGFVEKRDYAVEDLLGSRGADKAANPEMIAQITADKALAAGQSGRTTSLTTAIDRIIPQELKLQQGTAPFVQEQARHKLMETPADLLSLHKEDRDPLGLRKVEMTFAEYQKVSSGDASALPRTFALGASDTQSPEFEAVIKDPNFKIDGKTIANLHTGTVLNFGQKDNQKVFDQRTSEITEQTGFSHRELTNLWASQHDQSAFNENFVPTAFNAQRDTRNGTAPSGMFLNQFTVAQQGFAITDPSSALPQATRKAAAEIPAMPPQRLYRDTSTGDVSTTNERDGVTYNSQFIASGRADDETNPWAKTIQSLVGNPNTTKNRLKETNGSLRVFSDREAYEKAVASGSTGIDLANESWAQGNLTEAQETALQDSRVRVKRDTFVARNTIDAIAAGKATIGDVSVFQTIGSAVGAGQKTALYAPNTAVASTLRSTLSAVGKSYDDERAISGMVYGGSQKLLNERASMQQQSKNVQLKDLIGGVRKQVETGLNNDGTTAPVVDDSKYILSTAGVSGYRRAGSKDPFDITEAAAAQQGIESLIDQRQKESAVLGKQFEMRIGGESGFDMIAGQAAKERGVPLSMMLPMNPEEFIESSKMGKGDQERFGDLLSYAQKTGGVFTATSTKDRQEGELVGDLQQARQGRNAMLVANQGRLADEMVTYWNGSEKSPAANTLQQAAAFSVPITNLRQGGPSEAPAMPREQLAKNMEAAVNATRVTTSGLLSQRGMADEEFEKKQYVPGVPALPAEMKQTEEPFIPLSYARAGKPEVAPPELPQEMKQRPGLPTEMKQGRVRRGELPPAPPADVVNTTQANDPMHEFVRKAANMVPDVEKLAPGGVHLVSQEEAAIQAKKLYGDTAVGKLRGWNDPATGSAYVTRQDDSVQGRATMAYTTLHEIGHLAVDQVMQKNKGPKLFDELRKSIFDPIMAMSGTSQEKREALWNRVGKMSDSYRTPNDVTHEFLANTFAQGYGARDFANDPRLMMQPNPQHRDKAVNEGGARKAFSFFNQLGGRFASIWNDAWKGATRQPVPGIAGIAGPNTPAPFLARTPEDLVQHVEGLSPIEAKERQEFTKIRGSMSLDNYNADQHEALDESMFADYVPVRRNRDQFEHDMMQSRRPTDSPHIYSTNNPIPVDYDVPEVQQAPTQNPVLNPADFGDTQNYDEAMMNATPHIIGEPDPQRMVMGENHFRKMIESANARQEVTAFAGEAFMTDEDRQTVNVSSLGMRKQLGMQGLDRNRNDNTFVTYGMSQADLNHPLATDFSYGTPDDPNSGANQGIGFTYDPKNQKLQAAYGDRELDWLVQQGDKQIPAHEYLAQMQQTPVENAATLHRQQANRGKAKGNEWAQIAHDLYHGSGRQMGATIDTGSTKEQQAIVDAAKPGSRIVVNADAGTGKTRTSMAVLANLLKEGVLPEQMSMITFTNKGIDEFKGKIKSTFGDKAAGLLMKMNIKNSSSLANEIIRGADSGSVASIVKNSEFDNKNFSALHSDVYRRASGREVLHGDGGWHPGDDVMMMHGVLSETAKNFSSLPKEQQKAFKALQTEASGQFRYGKFKHEMPDVKMARLLVGNASKLAQNNVLGREAYADAMNDPHGNVVEKMRTKFIANYQAQQFSEGRLGHEESNLVAMRALESPVNQGFLKNMQQKFRHLFVDEGQDLSHIQSKILEMLSGGQGIAVAGDEKQAIYGWRGAAGKIKDMFSGISQVLPLQQSWRSQQKVLDTINKIHGTNTSLPEARKESGKGGEVTASFTPQPKQSKEDIAKRGNVESWQTENNVMADSVIDDILADPKYMKDLQEGKADQAMIMLPNHARIQDMDKQLRPRLEKLGINLRMKKSDEELRQLAIKKADMSHEPDVEHPDYQKFSGVYQQLKDEHDSQQGIDLGTTYAFKGAEARKVYLGGATGEGSGQIIRTNVSKAMKGASTFAKGLLNIHNPEDRRDAEESENLLYVGMTRAKETLRLFGSGLRESRLTAAAVRALGLPTARGEEAAAAVGAGSDVLPTTPPPVVNTTHPTTGQTPRQSANAEGHAKYLAAFGDSEGLLKRVGQQFDHALATGEPITYSSGNGPSDHNPDAAKFYRHEAEKRGLETSDHAPRDANDYETGTRAFTVRQGPGGQVQAAPTEPVQQQNNVQNVNVAGMSQQAAAAISQSIAGSDWSKLPADLKQILSTGTSDLAEVLKGMDASQLGAVAASVGGLGKNIDPALQQQLSSRLPAVVTEAHAQGMFNQVASDLSRAGFDASTGVFRGNNSGGNNGPPRTRAGFGTAGGGSGGSGEGAASTSMYNASRTILQSIESLGKEGGALFEKSIDTSSKFAYITTRAGQVTGRSQQDVELSARQAQERTPGVSLLDAARVQRYETDASQQDQILRFSKVTGMDIDKAALQSGQLSKTYGGMTRGEVLNVASAVRGTGTIIDEEELLHGASVASSYGVRVGPDGKRINGPGRMADAMVLTNVLAEAGVDTDQGTRQLFQQMTLPDANLGNMMRKAQFAMQRKENPNISERDLNMGFTNEAVWSWDRQQAGMLNDQKAAPFQLQVMRSQSGLNDQGFSAIPTGIGAQPYKAAVMGSSLSSLSDNEVNFRMQSDNLRFERENIGRQSKILDIQQTMQNRGLQQDALGIASSGLSLRQSQEQLGIKREEFGLQKQQNQLGLKEDRLDLAQLKLKSSTAGEVMQLQMQKTEIGFAGTMRDLEVKKRELPLRGQQMDLQIESQAKSIEWEKEGIQFHRWYDEQMQGTIGSDRSYRAQLALDKGELNSARSNGLGSTAGPSGFNQTQAEVKATPVMGLQNEQFYAGITHQLAQMQYGRTAFRSEAAYSENVDYVKKQTDFYERRMAIEDKAREFSYRMQDEQLSIAEKQYDVQKQLLELQKEQLDNEIKDQAVLIPIMQRLAEIDFDQQKLDISQQPERIAIKEQQLGLKEQGVGLSERSTELGIKQEEERIKIQGAQLELQKADLADKTVMLKLQQEADRASLKHQEEQLKFQEEMNRRQGNLLETQKKLEELAFERAKKEAELLDYIINSRETEMNIGGGTDKGTTMGILDFAIGVNEGVKTGAIDPRQVQQPSGNRENPAIAALFDAALSGKLDEDRIKAYKVAMDVMSKGGEDVADRRSGPSANDKSYVDNLNKQINDAGGYDADKFKNMQELQLVNMGKMAKTTLDATLALEEFKGKLGSFVAPSFGPGGSTADIANVSEKLIVAAAAVQTFTAAIGAKTLLDGLKNLVVGAGGPIPAAVPALVRASAVGLGGYLGFEGAKDLGIDVDSALNNVGSAWDNYTKSTPKQQQEYENQMALSAPAALMGMFSSTWTKWTGGSEEQQNKAYQDTFTDSMKGYDALVHLPEQYNQTIGLLGNKLAEGIQGGSEAVGKYFNEAGSGGTRTVKTGSGTQSIKEEKITGFERDVIEPVKNLFGNIGKGIAEKSKDAGEWFAGVSKSAQEYISGIGTQFDTLKADADKEGSALLKKTGDFFSGIGKWFDDQKASAGKESAAIGKSIGLFFGSISTWFDTQKTAIGKESVAIGKSIGLFFSGIGKWFTDEKTAFDKSIKETKKNIDGFFGGIGAWFGGIVKELEKLTKNKTFANLNELFTSISKPLQDFFSALGDMIKKLAEKLNPMLKALGIDEIKVPGSRSSSNAGGTSGGATWGPTKAPEDGKKPAGKAIGDRNVSQDMIAQLHQGEAVLTVPQAAAFRAGLESASVPSVELKQMVNQLSGASIFNQLSTATNVQAPAVTMTAPQQVAGNTTTTNTVTINQTVGGDVSDETLKKLKEETLSVVIDALKKVSNR